MSPLKKQVQLLSGLLVAGFLSAGHLWAAPPQLKVSGNQLVTASGGCTVFLKGVNVDSMEWYDGGGVAGEGPPSGNGGSVTQVVQKAVTAWGARIVRLPLDQDQWFGISGRGPGAGVYQNTVSQCVAAAANNNAYIILDLHWSGDDTTASPPSASWTNSINLNNGHQLQMPDANAVTFWQSVATAFANNPAVLFDLYNEPHLNNLPVAGMANTAWTVWRNGGSTNGGDPTTVTGMQTLLNAVRGVGANNVCLAGGLSWCSSLGGINGEGVSTSFALTDTASGNGVVYSAHLYGNNDGTSSASWNPEVGDTGTATLTANYPLFIGEIGPTTGCNSDSVSFDSNVFAWMPSVSGIAGGTAWSMHTSSCPNMLSNWSFNTTAWGGAVTTWLATPVPTCPTGATNTPTFTPTVTSTLTKTLTPTVTATLTATLTATRTLTPSMTPTATLSATPSATATNTKTLTPTVTATATNSPLLTPTKTMTPTVTSTLTATLTATWTPTPTLTRTLTPTSTPTLTRTMTLTATVTLTPTITDSPTLTPTPNASFTPSFTPTQTLSPTDTSTASSTPTVTVTGTWTASPTATVTSSPTDTPMFSPTPTRTPTATQTPTLTPAATSTPSWTATDTPTLPPPTATPTSTWTSTPTVGLAGTVFLPPYPNPSFGASVTFQVNTPAASTVRLSIFTTAFRMLLDKSQVVSGGGKVVWGLCDMMDTPVSNGVYYARLEVIGDHPETKIWKILVLK